MGDVRLKRAIRNGHGSTTAVPLRREFAEWCRSLDIPQAPGLFRYWIGLHHPLHYDEAHDLWQATELTAKQRAKLAGGGA